jgi:hypothetical protein
VSSRGDLRFWVVAAVCEGRRCRRYSCFLIAAMSVASGRAGQGPAEEARPRSNATELRFL